MKRRRNECWPDLQLYVLVKREWHQEVKKYLDNFDV